MVSNWLLACRQLPSAHGLSLLAFQERFAFQENTEPLLQRLPPERRAMVVMALLGLVLVGLALIMFAWLGGRYFRRLTHKPLPPAGQGSAEQWYRKPLHPESPPSGDQDSPPGS